METAACLEPQLTSQFSNAAGAPANRNNRTRCDKCGWWVRPGEEHTCRKDSVRQNLRDKASRERNRVQHVLEAASEGEEEEERVQAAFEQGDSEVDAIDSERDFP